MYSNCQNGFVMYCWWQFLHNFLPFLKFPIHYFGAPGKIRNIPNFTTIDSIDIILLSSWWNSQRELRKFILRRSEFPFPFFCFPFPFFCFFAFERFLLSQKENLIFRPQKWIFEISEVCFLPFFSFVLCANCKGSFGYVSQLLKCKNNPLECVW